MKSIPIVLALVLGLVSTAMAETRYVSDRLEIQMRTGKGTQFRILRMLPSGTALEILEVDQENGYSRVRTPSGVEGWVLSRYLMARPAARDQVASATERASNLEVRVSDLAAQVEALTLEEVVNEFQAAFAPDQHAALSIYFDKDGGPASAPAEEVIEPVARTRANPQVARLRAVGKLTRRPLEERVTGSRSPDRFSRRRRPPMTGSGR